MPVIEWTHNGSYRRCDSSDPEIVAKWLLERVKAAPPGGPSDWITLRIYSLGVMDPKTGRQVPDWAFGDMSFGIQGGSEDLKSLENYILAWEAKRQSAIDVQKED